MKSGIIKLPTKISITLLGIFFVFFCQNIQASAVTGFNPGKIIDDAVFTNFQSMNVSQIQNFLNSKMPTCDTWGTVEYRDSGITRAQFVANTGNPAPPYTCLKDYSQDGKSSAQIIYEASQEFHINPQVILVLLQKEQSLITDDWPWPDQYKSATGYGCPDTAPCDSKYFGLTNQIRNAAEDFRMAIDNSPDYYSSFVIGNNFVQYAPDPGCGGTIVNIQNQATRALYTYTPYQPNQASLNAGYGSGDYCSSYGNRNFYSLFTDWFGSISGFIANEKPRWMEIANDTHKKDPSTGYNIDQQLQKGLKLRFVSKILIDNKLYLRTEYDDINGYSKGVLYNDLVEIPYEPFITPRYLEVATFSNKVQPNNGIVDYNQPVRVGDKIKFSSKTFICNQWYYRTEYDTVNNNNFAIPASSLAEINYSEFERPRWMNINKDTQKINPVTGEIDSEIIKKDSCYVFNSKVYINGILYYRIENDTDNNISLAIDSTQLSEIIFEPFSLSPTWLRLKNNSQKVIFSDINKAGLVVESGRDIKIYDKTTINNTTYYRTEFDHFNNYNSGLLSSDFEDINYIQMERPRKMRLSTNSQKQDPRTNIKASTIFYSGLEINFSTKIIINGKTYLRSVYDTNLNNDLVIPFEDLLEI